MLDAGNNVTRWKNKISGQVDASANTTNINNVNSSIYTYPKIVTNIPNGGGLPFMKLSGGADQVGFDFSGGNLITGTELNQQTLFMFGYMYGTRVNTGSNGMFFAKYGPYSDAGILHVTWDNANSKIYVLNNGGTSNTDNILNVNPGYYMISITIDCSGGSSSLVNIRGYGITDLTRVNYIIDDGTVNKSMTGTSRTSDLHNFQIGYWEAGNNSYRRSMNGAIGETMYFNRILSMNERYILEGKIAWKYGQAAILPDTHPYKTFPPSETAPPVTNAVSIIGGVIYLNGVANPTVTFAAGGRYLFDQSAASNSNNPISFSRESSGTPLFLDGVTIVGTPGQAGAYTRIDLSGGFTGNLYYLLNLPIYVNVTAATGTVLTSQNVYWSQLSKNANGSNTIGTRQEKPYINFVPGKMYVFKYPTNYRLRLSETPNGEGVQYVNGVTIDDATGQLSLKMNETNKILYYYSLDLANMGPVNQTNLYTTYL